MTPVERARSLLDVPWRHQGRDPAVGIDCIGLLVIAFEVQDDYTSYGRNPLRGLLEQHLQQRFGAPHAPDDAVPGDIVAMAYAGPIRHVGIVASDEHGLTLIHTDSILGRVTEHPLDAKWHRRVRQVYRP